MDELNAELAKIVSEAKKSKAANVSKDDLLKKYKDSILKLIDNDVQMHLIHKWLVDDKKEKLAANTLRSFIVKEIGREKYEDYLKRNGWLKVRRAGENKIELKNNASSAPAKPELSETSKETKVVEGAAEKSKFDLKFDIPTLPKFKKEPRG